VWFPIAAPVLLSIIFFVAKGGLVFDYLMPAEFFLFALVGSGLLLWATLRIHSRVKWIVWGISIAVFMFFGGQWFAEVTGLASGETEPTGWRFGIVIASLTIYWLGLVLVGTIGALLLRDLFKKRLLSA